jgi:hypothetical protein
MSEREQSHYSKLVGEAVAAHPIGQHATAIASTMAPLAGKSIAEIYTNPPAPAAPATEAVDKA